MCLYWGIILSLRANTPIAIKLGTVYSGIISNKGLGFLKKEYSHKNAKMDGMI
jgi:hypothetical protein